MSAAADRDDPTKRAEGTPDPAAPGGKKRKGRKKDADRVGGVFTSSTARNTATGDPAVIARNLCVEFIPYVERKPTFRGMFTRRKRRANPVVALDDVSLSINKGEAFGVVGANGAGKSTLLKVLAGTLPPDSGSVDIYGTSPSLLALGVGFNRNLSGRRNVYLGGLGSGLRRSEIDERFEQVVEYADIGVAIDRPVNTYSSGMYSRLAFAVAMQSRPDILLVDELFSVGDQRFRAKSAETMEQILHDAGTIVMVSHSLGRMSKFCDRVAWIDKGKVQKVGEAAEVIEAYQVFSGVDSEEARRFQEDIDEDQDFDD